MSSISFAEAPRRQRRLIAFLRDDQGGPLAEMAVLLIPMMMMIAMVIEGGNILWRHQIALKAAHDSSRYLSRVQRLFDDNCALDSGILQFATDAARNLGVSGLLGGGLPLIPGLSLDDIQIPLPDVITAVPCVAVVRAVANVDLPLPFAPIFRLVNPDQPNTITFSVAQQARWTGE
jgi:hypothetical protein